MGKPSAYLKPHASACPRVATDTRHQPTKSRNASSTHPRNNTHIEQHRTDVIWNRSNSLWNNLKVAENKPPIVSAPKNGAKRGEVASSNLASTSIPCDRAAVGKSCNQICRARILEVPSMESADLQMSQCDIRVSSIGIHDFVRHQLGSCLNA